MQDLQEPIYKGATRPAMKAGVPLMVLLLVFMPTITLSVWAVMFLSKWIAVATVAVLVPLYFWMRRVTSKDDQRLTQMIIALRLALANRNRRLWQTRSYSSHRPRERS